ncbi:MAG TPA: class I SAM-dependent methyltransferase [Thermoanaerobaculia bacterium]
MSDTTAEKAAAYWDANREKARDPAYWMAQPLCRQAINRRVSGSPHEWPLDWFKRVHAPRAFGLGVSWGCGLGAFERSARRLEVVSEIEAFDVSEASLGDARREAEKDGIEGIHYRFGNFDDPHLERRRYDIAFFHASLHHVSGLERLFRRLTFALKRGGGVYVDEYVGPSRGDWTREHLGLAQAVLDMLPAEGKLRSEIDLPIEMNDPSEAIRSSEIPRFLRNFFDIVAWRPYGGQIVDLVMPNLAAEWVASPEGLPYVAAMLEIEDYELSRNPASTHYLVAYGTLKSLPRLAGPLADQVRKALGRRLKARLSG